MSRLRGLSFRGRLTLAVALAVTIAVASASAVVFVVVRGQLRGEVDGALRDRADQIAGLPVNTMLSGRGWGRYSPYGGAEGVVQIVTADGDVIPQPGEPVSIPVSDQAKAVANGRRASYLQDATVQGRHLRVLVLGTEPAGYAVMVVRPLDEVDAALSRIKRFLVLISAGGIGLAAILAFVVMRTAVAPVRRLTRTTEYVAETRDLSGRIEVTGNDELARLAASFNTMLEALEESQRAQRQLVADASHELRTPLTSLRTNIEVLARSEELEPDERERLLADVVEQLGEMSTLVSELVLLARGEEPAGEPETIQLDTLVAGAVERARRNHAGLVFATSLEESTIEGVPSAIERAVGNLLDNAGKWSPTGGTVEVFVRGPEVSVGDQGPGIDPADRPFVFDRFYRAATARGMPGSGLGLAIVKQVADAHGGDVSVDESPGGGALLRLRLGPRPTVPRPPQAQAERPALLDRIRARNGS